MDTISISTLATLAGKWQAEAARRRLELRVGRLVPKRAHVGVLQKRSCAVWLLCYSNHINNATGETKWQRNK